MRDDQDNFTLEKNAPEKQLLRKLKEEIEKLEETVRTAKRKNTKAKIIRAARIIPSFLRFISPYVLAAYLTVTVFSLNGSTPFIIDEYKHKKEIMKDFDNRGNIRQVEQYDDFERHKWDEEFPELSVKSSLVYISKWVPINDAFYTRVYEVYSLENITEDTITNLLEKDSISSLQEILGAPIESKNETRNNLSEEEIANGDYLNAVIYDELKDDYIIIRETIGANIGTTAFCLLVIFLAECIAQIYREESRFSIEGSIAKIKSKYPIIHTAAEEQRLEIKRNNYKRLTRE